MLLSSLASLYCMIAVMRLMIAVLRLAITISISIAFLLSYVFPFGNYIIAYSAEYVKGFPKKMKKNTWENRIKRACEAAGTYQPFFDSVIDTLARIMELRDSAQKQFEQSGGKTIVRHTNQGGSTNEVKNPALVVLMDCNTQALAYWRELGLTSRAYKTMTGSLNVRVESKSLEEALTDLGI